MFTSAGRLHSGYQEHVTFFQGDSRSPFSSMHPFSIERLTAPDTPEMASHRTFVLAQRGYYNSGRLKPQISCSPVSPGVESTGSRDCSPDTSFEALHVDLLPSPTVSDDSGRDSPDQLDELASPAATSALRLQQISEGCAGVTSRQQIDHTCQRHNPCPENLPLPWTLDHSFESNLASSTPKGAVVGATMRLHDLSEYSHHGSRLQHDRTASSQTPALDISEHPNQTRLNDSCLCNAAPVSHQSTQQDHECHSAAAAGRLELDEQIPAPCKFVGESGGLPNLDRASPTNSERDSIPEITASVPDENVLVDEPHLKPNEKPSHSYIGLISMALLASAEKKLVLSDIYQYIMDRFPYYDNQDRAWRNSIRHNLSLNECFIKAGRADNGKGNYWAIHPACVEDFAKGDFRRRQARRRARAGAMDGLPDPSPWYCRYPYAMGLPGFVPMTSASMPSYHPYLPAFPFPTWSQQHCSSVPLLTETQLRGLTPTSYLPTQPDPRMPLVAQQPSPPGGPDQPPCPRPSTSILRQMAPTSAHRFAPYLVPHRRW